MSDVRYPKEMREIAKAKGLELVTVALPGMVYQAPLDKEEIHALWNKFNEWLEERRKRRPTKRKTKRATKKL